MRRGGLWAHASVPVFYEDFIPDEEHNIDQTIVVASEERWSDLIKRFARNPREIRQLSARGFEELIAELLIRDGMDVTLTPKSRDGGKDILARANTNVGTHLYVVECKRYAENKLVDVRWVRSLYGTVESDRATAGLIVTTSGFTGPAREFCKTVQHRMSLRDFEQLSQWLMKHGC